MRISDWSSDVCSSDLDRRAENAAFGDRRVEYAGLAIFLLQTGRGAEHAAEIADVLAEDHDIVVALHHHIHRRVQGLDHVHGRHDQCAPCAASTSSRWRCRCTGSSLNTSSNIVAGSSLVLPSVPIASASRSAFRSEEHTSELQSLMSTTYAVYVWKT